MQYHYKYKAKFLIILDWLKALINWILHRNIFLSFVEESWPGQKPNTYIGRLEIYYPGNTMGYSDDEVSTTANGKEQVKKMWKFRDKWDFANVSTHKLKQIKEIIKQFRS